MVSSEQTHTIIIFDSYCLFMGVIVRSRVVSIDVTCVNLFFILILQMNSGLWLDWISLIWIGEREKKKKHSISEVKADI